MKRTWLIGLALVVLLSTVLSASATPTAYLQTTGIPITGTLFRDGSAYTGPCHFQAALYDAEIGVTELTSDVIGYVNVIDGAYSTSADFGTSLFDGRRLWLEVSAQCIGDSGYITESRSEIQPVGYAIWANGAGSALTADSAITATTSHTADIMPWSGLTGLSCGSGQLAKWNGIIWYCADDISSSIVYTAGIGTAGRVADWLSTDTLGASNVTLASASPYTLTVPGSGTAALLGTENVFTGKQTILGTTNPQLVIKYDDSNYLNLIAENNGAMTLEAIGGSNPILYSRSKIQVNKNFRVGMATADSYSIAINSGTAISPQYSEIIFAQVGSAKWQIGNTNANALRIFDNAAWETAVYITSGGSVGIGTTGAAAKLAINGGLHVGGDSDPGDNNIYADGNVSADSFTDRTPGLPDGYDALAALKSVSSQKSGGAAYEIDHATLPDFASRTKYFAAYTYTTTVPIDLGCRPKSLDDQCPTRDIVTFVPAKTVPERDIGAMVTLLTRAVQQLDQQSTIPSPGSSTWVKPPARSGEKCDPGEMANDDKYFYICVSATWKRIAYDNTPW